MNNETTITLEKYTQDKYKYGFVTDIESDRPKKGLNEDTIRFISKKKNTEAAIIAIQPIKKVNVTRLPLPTELSINKFKMFI